MLASGVSVDPKKVEAVMSWERPNNFKSVFSGYIWILHSLSFPTVPKTPKTEFG